MSNYAYRAVLKGAYVNGISIPTYVQINFIFSPRADHPRKDS